MLSGKLIRLIESHWDQITARTLNQIRHDPQLHHLRKLPDIELKEWAQIILENLDHWLAVANEDELAQRYETEGRLRFEESVPLHETVRGLCYLKEQMFDYVQEQGVAKTAVELYAEEELEHRLGRFFDTLLFHLVRGYEAALRRAAAAHA